MTITNSCKVLGIFELFGFDQYDVCCLENNVEQYESVFEMSKAQDVSTYAAILVGQYVLALR